MSADWNLAGSVILTGLALVFAILLILILLVEITGRILRTGQGSVSAPDTKINSAPKPEQKVAPKSPVVQAGIDGETVAAIMAAVTCMSVPEQGVRYDVKSISRSRSERPVWGFAGMQQNTRPF